MIAGVAAPKTHKLYCYVDETGQDTLGRLFIVAIVVTDRRDQLEALLEGAEQSSGKLYTKWRKTSKKIAAAYFAALLSGGLFGRVYAKTFEESARAHYDLEVLAAAKAIELFREENRISSNYKVTVAIDGLSKSLRPKIGSDFRHLGIKIRNVHGERDEASPIIRLADSVAGVVRDASEGRKDAMALKNKLEDLGILHQL